ncbi:MAG: sodium:proton antiporter [Rhodospirillales bacterium]|nr:sodium:proton antiporter [Rhodospirillales bacterium]
MNDFMTSMIDMMIVAIAVALIARRLRLPYTVGLVVAGIVLAFSPIHLDVALTQNVIFEIILPPLLFEAAINIRWKDLRQDALPVLTLAIPGTIISAIIVAATCHELMKWPLQPSLMFGVLIAATDPVAVIAMFKDNGVHGRLRLLVESESLLNDGVAAVLFALVLAWVQASGQVHLGSGQAARLLAVTVGGGVASGAVCAGLAIASVRRTTDHLVESAVTTVLAYGSFMLAVRFNCSGVLATVTAGLLMGNLGLASGSRWGVFVSDRGREFTLALWDFLAFIANSFVFLLIGLTVAGISFLELGNYALAVVILVVLASRALTIYPLCGLFNHTARRIPFRFQHVLWWGGLRGALGLALALSLPQSLPMRNQVLIATFGVVVFSVVVQGLTMPALLNFLKINRTR